MKNHIFLSLQPNWFFCMTWTILIICFQLPTATTCLSFYPSLHTKCLDPILHKQPYQHLWKKRQTFQPEQDLKFRALCTPRAPWTCSRFQTSPTPVSPTRNQTSSSFFRQKNWGEANKTCLPIWLQAKVEWIHKNWKMQKYWADSEPRHSTDFRTHFEIMIEWFVSCEIGQTCFTESSGSIGTL